MRTSVDEGAPRGPLERTRWEFALPKFPTATKLLTFAALAGAYFAAAKLGLGFALVHPSASAIWPPAGIALAAFLVLGLEMWPAIFLGALLANLTTYGSLATSLCVGVGNTLEGLLGAMLVNRYAHGSKFFIRPSDIVMFTGLAVGLSTTVSPTVGLTSLALGGFAPWKDYGNIWLTWWLGDAAGDLIVAPVLVLWSTAPRPRWHRRRLLEAATLVIGLSLVALIVFDGLVPLPGDGRLPVQFLCAPFLFWAAFRLGRRAVATCVLVLAFIAILGTLRGLGPLTRRWPAEYSTRVCSAARTSGSWDSSLGRISTAVSSRSLAVMRTSPTASSATAEIGSGVSKVGMVVPPDRGLARASTAGGSR